MRDEDDIRDEAKIILGFDAVEDNIQQGTGQIKTFNQLGFRGIADKPDGWYLPDDRDSVAIIFEAKSEREDVEDIRWISELKKNLNIAIQKYKRVIGILYNGRETVVLKSSNVRPVPGRRGLFGPIWREADFTRLSEVAHTLQHKQYYLNLFNSQKIDKQKIYTLTKRINDCLHIDFGIKNLFHRMIFTACALVAKRYDATLFKGMPFSLMKGSILSTLNKSLEKSKRQNLKLDLLEEVYGEIKMNNDSNQDAIDNFIEWVSEISESVSSDNWNGEDVMGIFFNEFNRYRKKSDKGQIFTPDHITSLMYRLIDCSMTDRILDATCGSGAFIVKAMCNMIKESGGINTTEAKNIKTSQLYGIEVDREIFALACANMLIHKDGKTNLAQLDSSTQAACDWISEKNITKVLMNPPYERKYKCMTIVENVLNNVPEGTVCAFILPDKKLEKDGANKTYGNRLLKTHTLTTIVKLPENLFFGVGVTTSIFIFIAKKPQNRRNIIGYYIEDDGLETVKNQGRQDIRNRWQSIEDYWVQAIHDGVDDRYNTRQIIVPGPNSLSYKLPTKPFEIFEEDFAKTALDYIMSEQKVDVQELSQNLLSKVFYSSEIKLEDSNLSIQLKDYNNESD